MSVPEPEPRSAVAPASSPAPPPKPKPKPWDPEHAPRVALQSAPAAATAPSPIGVKPAKDAKLHEIERYAWRVDGVPPRSHPYVAGAPAELAHEELRARYPADGKWLLRYGPNHVAIFAADGMAEQVLDLDPPDLPLSAKDREKNDVEQVDYRDGVLYVCRGARAPLPTWRGYVAAVDAATGALRWRSMAQTCDGLLAVVGDYVVTGYGVDGAPFQTKLLRRYDGAVVQSLPFAGHPREIFLDGTSAMIESLHLQIKYELR